MPHASQQSALRSATNEVIEVDVATLGINLEHLVRPIIDEAVYDLAQKDERKWEPVEVRLWPAHLEKPCWRIWWSGYVYKACCFNYNK